MVTAFEKQINEMTIELKNRDNLTARLKKDLYQRDTLVETLRKELDLHQKRSDKLYLSNRSLPKVELEAAVFSLGKHGGISSPPLSSRGNDPRADNSKRIQEVLEVRMK